MQLVYVGPHDEVEYLPDPANIDVWALARRGEPVDVDDDVAGRAPSQGDLGSGLLAQTANWAVAGEAPSPDAAAPETTAMKVADVLEWVGTDPTRAQQALVAEQATDQPRKTLVDHLEQITKDGDQ